MEVMWLMTTTTCAHIADARRGVRAVERKRALAAWLDAAFMAAEENEGSEGDEEGERGEGKLNGGGRPRGSVGLRDESGGGKRGAAHSKAGLADGNASTIVRMSSTCRSAVNTGTRSGEGGSGGGGEGGFGRVHRGVRGGDVSTTPLRPMQLHELPSRVRTALRREVATTLRLPKGANGKIEDQILTQLMADADASQLSQESRMLFNAGAGAGTSLLNQLAYAQLGAEAVSRARVLFGRAVASGVALDGECFSAL
eukprot:5574540-Pleurochrysis_carterae.AAC.1